MPTRILLVEDNPGEARLITLALAGGGGDDPTFRVEAVGRLADAVALVSAPDHGIGIVLLDMGLPDSMGIDTVRRMIAAAPDLPVVVLTGLDDEDVGAEAIHAGAQDYLVKGRIETDSLRRVMRYAIERNEARRTISRLNARNELILRALGEGVIGLDLDARITFANPAVEALTGWSPDEMVGREFHTLLTHSRVDGTPYPRDESPLSAIGGEARVRRFSDEVMWHRDGTSFPVEYVMTPIVENGRTTGAVVAFHDVVEQDQALDFLRRQLAFQQQMIDALETPFFYLDDSLFVIGCNRRLEQVLSVSRQEIVGLPVADALPDQISAEISSADLAATPNQTAAPIRVSFFDVEGNPHQAGLRKTVYTDPSSGEAAGLIVTLCPPDGPCG